ncbi:hypothetical protein [Streptomyces rimosus]|uniref:hypothetical protein n=1 Tax=Streptomyces rimosus TaxID=1927 RepID=UPI0004C035BE|nr:hypothetical protein [Streptomyces rimosus]
MRSNNRIRRLSADGTDWLWSVRHRHPDCREVLSLHRAGTRATLRIVFRAGPGRAIGDGYLPGGTAATGSHHLNLHEPGVVRRFLDEAGARGLLPTDPGDVETDGWALFDAVVAR